MPQLKNYREVGIFDLMSAPLNPIGAFDAEQFKKDVRALLAEKTEEKFLAVDLTGLDFVYSDAYNAFIQFQQEMDDRKGLFAILTNNQTIIDGLKKAGLDKNIKVFAFEADMMSFSLQASAPETAAPSAEVLEEPAENSKKKGLDVPFDEEPSSAKTVIIVALLLLAAVGGAIAIFSL